jgi:hypothetical protein
MAKLDPFTERRIVKFVADFRSHQGQLPTLQDLSKNGFDEDLVKLALKSRILEEFYVTLTNGSIVKGYKVSQTSPL